MGVVFAGMPGMLSYKYQVQMAIRSGAVLGGNHRHGRDVFLREGVRDADYSRDLLYRGIKSQTFGEIVCRQLWILTLN